MVKRFGAGDYQYEHVEGWGEFPGAGVVSDIATDSRDRVYACVRLKQGPDGNEGEMWVFDSDGSHLASWGHDRFEVPHGLSIGPNNELYFADANDHTVTRFSTDGDVLMTLGTKGEPGPPDQPFNSPTKAVVSAAGDIYVSDGYRQNRCHRFTADGELILSWGSGDPVYYQQGVLGEVTGTAGVGPGEFNLPHSIVIDRNERAYVLDRENARVQVFTSKGEYITEWEDVPVGCDAVIDEDDAMHIAGGRGVTVKTLDGKHIGDWGEKGAGPGQFRGAPHGIWIDSKGAVYVAEVGAQLALNKFARV